MRTVMQTAKGRRLARVSLVLVAVAALAMPVGALAGAQVPLKGSDRGSFTLTADGCGPGVFAVVVDDAGTATHLGAYAYHSSECFNGATGAFSGVFTMTAANGDTLSGTYAGTVVSVVGTFMRSRTNDTCEPGSPRIAAETSLNVQL